MKKSSAKRRMVSLQVRFPKTLLADLQELAKRDGRSLAGLLRQITEKHVLSERKLAAEAAQAIEDAREDFTETLPPRIRHSLLFSPLAEALFSLLVSSNDEQATADCALDLERRGLIRKALTGHYTLTRAGLTVLGTPSAQELIKNQAKGQAVGTDVTRHKPAP